MKKSIILRSLAAGLVALAAMTAQQAAAFPATHYAQSSKLASGNWVKIKITNSGMYQITDADARNWGFGGGAASLHVFGKGGAPISEKLVESIPDDLPQVPVVRSSGKLLFYAQGAITWNATTSKVSFIQVQHPYCNDSYYFVTDSPDYTDIEIAHDTSTPAGEAVTTFTERLYHEKDIVNPGMLGREMLGEDMMGTPTQSFSFDLKGKVAGSSVNVLTTMGVLQASTTGSGYFSFQQNGTNLSQTSSDRFSYNSTGHLYYTPLSTTKTFEVSTDKLNYSISLVNNGATLKIARLNAITVNYERKLALDGGSLSFATSNLWRDKTPMTMSGAVDGMKVWNVSIPHAPVELKTTLSSGNATFVTTGNNYNEYIAFNPAAQFASPAMVERVNNQDLHAQPVPDLIIITHQRYREQAQRVASLHESLDSMRVLVVNQEDVFNEFSSGQPDMMAYRMLCKMFYDRGNDGRHHLQHVLLMGCGSYDNKQVTGEFKNIAYPALLTWQSPKSSDGNNTFGTDDCIAALEDGSGNSWGNCRQCIGVGRFAVRSEEDARNVVDKLIDYVTKPDHGTWHNNIIVMSDDQDKVDSKGNPTEHFMQQCEDYISSAKASNSGNNYLFKRIYLDAYEAVSVGATRTYPGARDDLYGSLNDGVAVWSYNGHSSANVMSDHNMVRHNDFVNNMYHKHMPLLVATTCDLATYDACDVSGGELMFLNRNGGAIAVFSTNRQAYMDQNAELGKHIFKQLFSVDEEGNVPRLGDVFRLAKNAHPNSNNQAYFLMGDPAMRLTMPRYTARIEAINGTPVDPENKPVFKARQTISFSGSIVDCQGNRIDNFNGSVNSSLFDCEQSITTHGYGSGAQFTYQEHTNRIALGSDSVKNGQFTVKLTIPSEIMYSYDNFTPSLINLYASDARNNVDAAGSSEDFYIYGYDETIKTDTIGPNIIYLGLNSENFNDGNDVNESPLVIASIADPYGINLSDAGIGHCMTLTLDGDIVYSNVNKYYTPLSAETGQKGAINFPLHDLANGHHTLRLRVWNVYGNMSEKTITFNVVNGLKPELYEVYATENPARTSTTFYVKHNRPGTVLNMSIEVFDLMGRLVWKTQQSGQSDMYTSFPVTWNLNDMGGNRVPRGIYIYRATISTDGVREATKSKKLAVTSE